MPRPVAKLQAEKSRPKSLVPVATPPVQEQKRTTILFQKRDKSDEAEAMIMDELLSKVMEGCFKVYSARQRAPFFASWAKSYSTQMVARQFMCLDEGEEPEEASQSEDSEPVSSTPDVWALGCVPVIKATHQPHVASQQETIVDHVPAQTEPSIDQQFDVVAETNDSLIQAEKETSPRRSVSDKECKTFKPCTPPKTDRKKKKLVILPPKHVSDKLLPPLSSSAEKKTVKVESELKSKGENLRHSVSTHIVGSIYQHKDSKPIPKLDPSRLPRHRVFIQYEIVDNNHTQSSSKKLSGLSRLAPRYKKQHPQ